MYRRAMEETLIGIFGQVLETEQEQDTDAAFGRQVRTLLSEQGGVAALAEQCETVSAWHRGNDLPLLWPIHAKHRVLLFRLLDLMNIQTATQDRSLLDALEIVSAVKPHVTGTPLSFGRKWLNYGGNLRLDGGPDRRRSGPHTERISASEDRDLTGHDVEVCPGCGGRMLPHSTLRP